MAALLVAAFFRGVVAAPSFFCLFFGEALGLRAAGFFGTFFVLEAGLARAAVFFAAAFLDLEDFLEALILLATGLRMGFFLRGFFAARFAFFAIILAQQSPPAGSEL